RAGLSAAEPPRPACAPDEDEAPSRVVPSPRDHPARTNRRRNRPPRARPSLLATGGGGARVRAPPRAHGPRRGGGRRPRAAGGGVGRGPAGTVLDPGG